MSLFEIAATELPDHSGVPTSALDIRPEGLDIPNRLAAAFSKFAASRVQLGENEERWAQEAHEELLRQHPWLSNFTVSTELSTTTPDGYGVGFFRVTPAVVPAAVAGPETIHVITVPIIVRDFRLYPLDVFAHENQLFPLTEDRVIPVLRLRDAFTEVDRDFSRAKLKRQDASGSGGGFNSGFFSRTFKGSAEDVHEKIASLVVACAAVLDETPEKSSVEGPTLVEKVREKVSEQAVPCAAEIRIGTDVQYRVAWASDMESGLPRVEPFQKTSLATITKVFGDDVTAHALEHRHIVVNMNPDDPAALAALLPEKTSSEDPMMQPVAVASEFNKLAAAGPACVRRFIFLPRAKYEKAQAHEFAGVAVHRYEVGEKGCCARSRGTIGILDTEGAFVEADSWSAGRSVYAMGTVPYSGTMTPMNVRGLADGSICDAHYAVWQQGGCVYGVRLGAHSVNTSDGEYWPITGNHGDDYESLARISDDFRAAYYESVGDTSVLNIPATAWIVGPEGPLRHGEPLTIQGGEPTGVPEGQPEASLEMEQAPELGQEAAPPGPEQPELLELPVDAKVAFDGVRYHVEAGTSKTSGTRVAAEFALASGGVPARLVNVLMDSCSAGRPAAVRYRTPYHGAGRELGVKMSQTIGKRMAAVSADTTRAVAAAKWVASSAKAEALKASGADGAAVDTVLFLGFLNEDNLLRYVDMAPTFDKALSYLCSLLLASRLGLDEVSEQSVESAIRGVDAVLSSLRVVEYALTK